MAVCPEPQGMGAAPQKRANALGVAKPADISGLGDDRGSEVSAGALKVGERVVVFCEQLGDLAVEVGDACVEIVDVAGELADAARCSPGSEAWAELESSELVELTLAIAADNASLCDRVVLGPVGA